MPVIGIDLGTTNSLVSYFDGQAPKLIPNALGKHTTPSVVSFDSEKGEILVGQTAKERLISHPQYTAACFKRAMGTQTVFNLGKKSFSATELSAIVLKQLKQDAEAHLGEEVSEAVISVPAYFSDAQRQATKQAGQLAGLNVERLVNEPTAAALAYGLNSSNDEQLFMVVDMGGGTLDVSILDIFENVIEVRASSGDNFLGGEDFSLALRDNFLATNGIALKKLSNGDLSRLAKKIDGLKHQLSTNHSGAIDFTFGKKELHWEVSRQEFESLIAPLIKRFTQPIERALRDSKTNANDLDNIILVGGATRMHWVRSEITRLFKKLPASNINPDEVVGLGTGVQVALKERNQAINDVVLTDVCPYTLGVDIAVETGRNQHEAGHFLPIIERNMTVPVSREERLFTLRDNQTSITCNIFQGESRLTKNNVELGSLTVKVPKGKASEQYVDVRFTYDINGILEVIVKVGGTDTLKRALINNTGAQMNEAEMAACMKKLDELKVHPRETAQNRDIVARLERLYEEHLGDHRRYLSSVLTQFESALNSQDLALIDAVKTETLYVIEDYEKK